MQESGGQWHVVEYYSRKLNDTESRYCATDKEFLAIDEAVTKHWRHRLLDRCFEILTDHNPLTRQIKIDSKHQDNRRTRWVERLQCFNYRIRYLKGKHNGLADGLSRNPEFCKMAVELLSDFALAVTMLHEKFHWGTRKIRKALHGRAFPRDWRKLVYIVHRHCAQCTSRWGTSTSELQPRCYALHALLHEPINSSHWNKAVQNDPEYRALLTQPPDGWEANQTDRGGSQARRVGHGQMGSP